MTGIGTLPGVRTGDAAIKRLSESFESFSRVTMELEDAYRKLREKAQWIDLELEETNRRLAAILGHLPVGVVVTNDVGQLTEINPAAAAILAVTPADVSGQRLDRLVGPSGADLIPLPPGGEAPLETEIEAADGRRILVRIVAATIRGRGGRSEGVVLTIEDLTEVETLRRDVHRLDKLASLGDMASRLAHQIRNPLNGIEGFAGLLGRALDGSVPHATYASRIAAGARDIDRILTNMLALARPAPTVTEPLPVLTVVDSAVAWIRMGVPDGERMTIRVRHDDPNLFVRAERFSLEEALRNLLVNAYDAVPGRGLLRIRTRRVGDELRIIISDTGPGVPGALRAQIFDPFITGRERGTGLGLAIVRSTLEQIGGSIALRPSGRGATFRIHVPLVPESHGGES